MASAKIEWPGADAIKPYHTHIPVPTKPGYGTWVQEMSSNEQYKDEMEMR
jgi:hypothetical protein